MDQTRAPKTWCKQAWDRLKNGIKELFKRVLTRIHNSKIYMIFWIVLYILSFIGFWISFYFTDTYHKYYENHEPNVPTRVTVHVAIGVSGFFLAPGITVVLCVAYDGVSTYLITRGKLSENTIYCCCRFSAATAFPILSAFLGRELKGIAGLWTCVGVAGVILSAIMCFGHIDADYGLADAFLAVALGILVGFEHGKHIEIKCAVMTVIAGLRHLVPIARTKIKLFIDEPNPVEEGEDNTERSNPGVEGGEQNTQRSNPGVEGGTPVHETRVNLGTKWWGWMKADNVKKIK